MSFFLTLQLTVLGYAQGELPWICLCLAMKTYQQPVL